MTDAAHNIGQLREIARKLEFTATRIGEPGCRVRLEAADDLAAVNWAIERLTATPSLMAAAPTMLEALQLALPKLAHRASCHSVRPTAEWAEHGSASFENCACEIKVVRAAIAAAEGEP